MHGQVMHQAAEDVVFGRGIDGWASVDENRFGDVEAQVCGVVGGDGADDPAGCEDQAAPGHEEGYAPEAVIAGMHISRA